MVTSCFQKWCYLQSLLTTNSSQQHYITPCWHTDCNASNPHANPLYMASRHNHTSNCRAMVNENRTPLPQYAMQNAALCSAAWYCGHCTLPQCVLHTIVIRTITPRPIGVLISIALLRRPVQNIVLYCVKHVGG